MAEFPAFSLILFISFLSLPNGLHSEAPFVGVNVGAETSSLSPKEIAAFLQRQGISHIRLLSPDTALLSHLSNTNITVSLSIPNNEILSLAASNSTAFSWVSRHILPFLPHTLFSTISVGNEVSSTFSLLPSLLPAMTNLQAALSSSNLKHKIKISSPISFSLIANPFPPSQAHFNATFLLFLSPFLNFLSLTSSPLMLNLYPHSTFINSKKIVPLNSALFKPLPQGKELIDRNTLLHYTNLYDAMIDAVYFSLKNLNFSEIPLLVIETGWPHKGDSLSTPTNAEAYVTGLIKHVMLEREGTPLHKEITPSAYIFQLFDNEGIFGMFKDDCSSNYGLHLEGSGGFLAKDQEESGRTFCVAMEGVEERELRAGLDWACGPGRANCEGIQPGEECFKWGDLREHASYAFDSYYQRNGRVEGSCVFGGVAMVTTTDPSHGRCIFPGSKLASRGGDSRAKAKVTDSNGAAIADVMPQLPFLLLSFSLLFLL